MFVGFGYLMTFLKGYGLGAVGFTMFITCLGVELALVIEAFMSKGKLNLSFASLLNGTGKLRKQRCRRAGGALSIPDLGESKKCIQLLSLLEFRRPQLYEFIYIYIYMNRYRSN